MWTISWCRPLIRRADPGRIPPIRRNSDAIPRLPLFLRIKFYSRCSSPPPPARRLRPPIFVVVCLLVFSLPRSFSFLFPLFYPRTFTPWSLSPLFHLAATPPLSSSCSAPSMRPCACESVLCSLASVVGLSPSCLVALLRFPSIFFFSFLSLFFVSCR